MEGNDILAAIDIDNQRLNSGGSPVGQENYRHNRVSSNVTQIKMIDNQS